MIPRYGVLVRRIRLELEQLDRTHQTIVRRWRKALSQPDDTDAFVESVALNLHSFYSGVERIFELIATEVDGGILGGENWHAELLRQMALDLPDVRPSVLQRETAAQLDEYRKFRHRIRHIYATDLDAQRMVPLVDRLPGLWATLRNEIDQFLAFLEELSRSDI